jgi:hypothetical protein
MPSDKIFDSYIQLGVSGATLVILLVFVICLFRFMSMMKNVDNNSQNLQYSKLDKLCDKIDLLITSNSEHTTKLNEVLLTNDKDQKETIKLLKTILEVILDTQKRIVRVDDRTFKCLGDPKKGDEK